MFYALSTTAVNISEQKDREASGKSSSVLEEFYTVCPSNLVYKGSVREGCERVI